MANVILLSLVAMVLFGVSNGLQKIPVDRIGAVKFITCRGFVVSIITLILAIANFNAALFDIPTVLLGILLSAVSYFGLYFFSVGLAKSRAGIVIPIASSRTIITTFVGLLFLGEVLNVGGLLFILPIIIGIVLVSFDIKSFKADNSVVKKGVIYALLAALFWGVTMPFFGVFSNKLGVYTYSFILEFTVFCVSMIQGIFMNKNRSILPTRGEVKQGGLTILLVSVTAAIASIASNAAFATGFISIAAAVTCVSPLVSILIGRIFLHEKMTVQQYIGAVVIIVGLMGISII